MRANDRFRAQQQKGSLGNRNERTQSSRAEEGRKRSAGTYFKPRPLINDELDNSSHIVASFPLVRDNACRCHHAWQQNNNHATDTAIGTQFDVATVTLGDGDWSDVIAGIHARRAAVLQHSRSPRFDRDGQPINLLNISQRCELLCDPGTLRPIGRMAGKPEYDDNGEIVSYTPANFVLAHGKVGGRRIVCAGEDFTIGGGSPNTAGLKLSTATEKEALRFRCPLVR
eukprot:COSAG06_NODE_9129_length_1979_cov_1.454787_3_plen_226_part_01